MKSTTLMIMRHAKTEWNSRSGRDYDRCLTDRGRCNAPKMGRWIVDQNHIPDRVLASTAKRAEQTTLACSAEWQQKPDQILWNKDIYLASLSVLLGFVAEDVPPNQTSLLVGHNPGLSDLILYLCADDLPMHALANLMPTAAIAVLELKADIDNVIDHGAWQCVDYITPKLLANNE